MNKHTMVQSLSCSPAYFLTCQLWPWCLISDLNNQYYSVYPLTIANMSTKYNEHSGLISIMFTSLLPVYMSIVTLTFDLFQVWWRSTQRFSFYRVHKVKVWRTQAHTDTEAHTDGQNHNSVTISPPQHIAQGWKKSFSLEWATLVVLYATCAAKYWLQIFICWGWWEPVLLQQCS